MKTNRGKSGTFVLGFVFLNDTAKTKKNDLFFLVRHKYLLKVNSKPDAFIILMLIYNFPMQAIAQIKVRDIKI